MKKEVMDTEKLVAGVKDVSKAATKAVKKTVKEVADIAGEKTEEFKSGVKKTAAKAASTTKKQSVKEKVVLQYLGKEIDKDAIVKDVKELWTKQMKKKVSEMKSLALYLKPEENKVYYVINDEVTGSIDL